MVLQSRLDLGRSFLEALLTPTLLQLLVGYLTVNVARQVQGTPSARVRAEADLRGLRVAVRSGTVSEALLRELNAGSRALKVTIVPLDNIRSGVDLLLARRVDAVLGDNLQLRYLLTNASLQGSRPSLALQGIRPESQAFALAPGLREQSTDPAGSSTQ